VLYPDLWHTEDILRTSWAQTYHKAFFELLRRLLDIRLTAVFHPFIIVTTKNNYLQLKADAMFKQKVASIFCVLLTNSRLSD
jgi:hypothetical protein